MIKFAKLNDDEHIEFAPTTTPTKSNFNLDAYACHAAGYLEVMPYPAYPEDSDGKQYRIKYRIIDEKIEPYWAEIIDNRTYAQKRKPEYPEVGDQLDAILKALAAIDADALNDINLPDDTRQLIAEWQAVKSRYPKPELNPDEIVSLTTNTTGV